MNNSRGDFDSTESFEIVVEPIVGSSEGSQIVVEPIVGSTLNIFAYVEPVCGSTSSRTCQLFPIFGSTIYFGPEIDQIFVNYYSTILQLLVETKLNNS